MTEKDIIKILHESQKRMSIYLCHEVKMPDSKERVDFLKYDKQKDLWTFYEIKNSLQDFNTKCAHTFRGNYNYYVLSSMALYEKVKNKIPFHIGVFIISDYTEWGRYCKCIKKAKAQDCNIEHEKLMFSLMQSLSREYDKNKKEKENV